MRTGVHFFMVVPENAQNTNSSVVQLLDVVVSLIS